MPSEGREGFERGKVAEEVGLGVLWKSWDAGEGMGNGRSMSGWPSCT